MNVQVRRVATKAAFEMSDATNWMKANPAATGIGGGALLGGGLSALLSAASDDEDENGKKKSTPWLRHLLMAAGGAGLGYAGSKFLPGLFGGGSKGPAPAAKPTAAAASPSSTVLEPDATSPNMQGLTPPTAAPTATPSPAPAPTPAPKPAAPKAKASTAPKASWATNLQNMRQQAEQAVSAATTEAKNFANSPEVKDTLNSGRAAIQNAVTSPEGRQAISGATSLVGKAKGAIKNVQKAVSTPAPEKPEKKGNTMSNTRVFRRLVAKTAAIKLASRVQTIEDVARGPYRVPDDVSTGKATAWGAGLGALGGGAVGGVAGTGLGALINLIRGKKVGQGALTGLGLGTLAGMGAGGFYGGQAGYNAAEGVNHTLGALRDAQPQQPNPIASPFEQ